MSQLATCPNCKHEFIPMSYEVMGHDEQPDGDIIHVMLYAGIGDTGLSDSFRLENDETVIVGKGKNAREEQRKIEWDDDRIRARIIRRLNEYAASRIAPANKTAKNSKSIVGEKVTLSYG